MKPSCCLLLSGAFAWSLSLSVFAKSPSPLSEQLRLYPQEKIHVTTDKDFYLSGDTVWMRAHVVDAASHQPVGASKYVYAELSDAAGALVRRIKILQQEGLYAGYLPLPADLASGDYTLAAYTRHQLNLDPDYLFRKRLRIEAFRPEVTSTRSRAVSDFDVSFFPEGGQLIPGEPGTVGFKALGDDGVSVAVEGRVVDNAGQEICTFRSGIAGMGHFGFIPRPAERYWAECRMENGKSKRFALPAAVPGATALQVIATDSLVIVMRRSETAPPAQRIVAQSRGRMLYDQTWPAGMGRILFRRAELPSGVIQLLLLDMQGNPLSERLFFNPGDEVAHTCVNVKPEGGKYTARGKVTVEIEVTDAAGNPLSGDFALAVTDRAAVPERESAGIRADLLLCSELKGYIEQPDRYFESPENLAELDNLLLTQGWKRYDVPEVLKGNYSTPQIPFEQYQSIEGRIVREGLFGKKSKLANYRLMALVPRFGAVEQTDIGKDGTFTLTGMDYPDSTTFVLRPISGKEFDREAIVKLASEPTAKIEPLPQWRGIESQQAEEDPAEMARKYVAWTGNADMRNVLIDPVMISAEQQRIRHLEKLKREDMSRPEFRKSAHTFTANQIAQQSAYTILDALLRMPGIELRGSRILYKRHTPIVAVDGIMDLSYEQLYDYGPSALGQVKAKNPEMPAAGILVKGDANRVSYVIDNSRRESLLTTTAPEKHLLTTNNLPAGLQYPIEFVSRIDLLDGNDAMTLWGHDASFGAISITLKSGDEWAELLRQAVRTDITLATPIGFQTPAAHYVPAYDTPEALKSHTPDFRTTLYWNPSVKAINGRATVECYLNDAAAEPSIFLEGVGNNKIYTILH